MRSDTLIASAGDLPLEKLQGLNIGLKQIIWVAEPSSRHMDWHEVPSGVGGKLDIGVWHEILDEPTRSDAGRTDLPTFSTDERSPTDILFVTLPTSDNRTEEPLIVEMEQKVLLGSIYVAHITDLHHRIWLLRSLPKYRLCRRRNALEALIFSSHCAL